MEGFTIIHRIEAPGLTEALNNLADALRGGPLAAIPVSAEQRSPGNLAVVQADCAPAANPTPAPVSAITSAPTAVAPTPAPGAAAAPVTSKPITFDEIVAAGSQLLEAGRMTDLLSVLGNFGVQAITQLKPEQYADVATALRGLGANI